MTHEEVIKHFRNLQAIEERVAQPDDDIIAIFDKITAWKKKFGDLEQQENEVSKKLKFSRKIKVHNIKTIMELLGGLQKDIGLTDDEITIIVYTSMDQDYLTNMVIMYAEFLKWFNLNFEGESQEEEDFKDNKSDAWFSTVTQAMEIISQYGGLKENKEVILTEKWWAHLRYMNFGSQLKEKMEAKPELKTELRGMFKAQNDKLSYYDLFQFIQHKLQIKLDNWEEDALEGRLDRLGMAFIEFNEFNEFSLDYGF